MKHSRSLILVAGMAASLALALPAFAQNSHPADPGTPDPTQAGGKKVVRTADDLPRHTYHIDGKASEFVLSDAPFKEFVAKVRADTEADLNAYDIQDRTTLQGYYGLLQQIALVQGRWSDAIGFIEKVRGLEEKQAKKLMVGQSLVALHAAQQAAGDDKARLVEEFKKQLKANVGALPYGVVAEEIKAAKGRAQIFTREIVLGQLQGQLDPVVAQTNGELSTDLAKGLIGIRTLLDVLLPVMPATAEVYGEIIAANAVPAKDVWTERLVTLNAADKCTPVVVGIWDSGVDVSLFSDRLYVNPKEKANGKDDDGNGFIDDVSGIAFDLDAKPTPALLHPVDQMRADKALVTSHMKGILDLQASIDSPEAAAFLKFTDGLKADQVSAFFEDVNLFGNYSHGTHVAGIASEGNPFARLLPARLTFDFREIPLNTPSVERAEAEARMYAGTVAYFKAAGVRVVNMSWGGSKKNVEEELEKKGVGATPEERAAIARELFGIQRDGLEAAIKSAPDILFIAAAGNSDDDNQFSESIPSGLNLPNLLTVGAVDKSGKPTGFTTFGKNVALYANGFEVESYIPGGERLRFSGTSMAAPNTTNLAAKLMAIRPTLRVAEVIEFIRKGATPMEGQAGRFIISPKASAALAGYGGSISK